MRQQKTCDLDLRIAVTRALIDAGIPRNAIRHEITLDSASSDGRADMVIALDHSLIGIEIKSGKDTFDRLESQRERYGARFDKSCLIIDALHEPDTFQGCSALGFDCVRVFDNGVLRECRQYWANRSAPWEPANHRDSRCFGAGERMAPHAMMSMLWAGEALSVSAELVSAGAIPSSAAHQRYRIVPHAAEHASIALLRPRIAEKLRTRQLNKWEQSFWARYDALNQEAVAA